MTKNRLLLIAVFSLTALAFGDTHYFAVREGNEKYRKGEYGQALKNYRRAQIEKDSDVSRYNLGNAYFRKKEYDKAAKLFSGVFSGAKESENAELASKSLYNYGNSRLAAGNEKADKGNLPGAMDDLKAAAGAYKKTLLGDPANANAKHNMELALNKLSEFEKKQKKKDGGKEEKEDNKNSPKDQNEKSEQKEDKKESESKKENEQEKQRKMKPEDAQRILEALAQNEKQVLKELRAKKMRERRLEKDW